MAAFHGGGVGGAVIRLMNRLSLRLGVLAAMLMGAFLYGERFGLSHLDPRNPQWLLAGYDQATYYIGWCYFRQEPWHWPPGFIANYCAPQGTSIGLVDALPILGLPLKAISGLLPESFQYFGLWTFGCCMLQSLLAYVLIGAVTSRIMPRLLGAGLFLLSPPFLQRHGHIALASHWVILAALCLHIRPLSKARWSDTPRWIVLATITAAIHVYLALMVVSLGIAALLRAWRPDRSLSTRGLVIGSSGMAAGVGAAWLAAGNFIVSGTAAQVHNSYGIYSANLNTLVNPGEMGRLLPKLEVWGSGQYEGFNYLGAGTLLLCIVGFAIWLSSFPRLSFSKRQIWLVLVILIMSLFAISNHIALGNRLVMQCDLPMFLHRIGDSLRASGRFLWPLYYALVFASIRAVMRHLPYRVSASLLAIALLLQMVDLAPSLRTHHDFVSATYKTRLLNPGWTRIMAAVSGVRVVPSCEATHSNYMDFKEFSWLASRARIPVTAGYAARVDAEAARKFDNQVRADADSARLDSRYLYVVRRQELPRIWAGAPSELAADVWDGYCVLFPLAAWPEHRGPFTGVRRVTLAEYLYERGGCLVLLSVKDEATRNLSESERAAMHAMGSNIDKLGYRHAYLGVAAGGRMVYERFGPEAALDVSLDAKSVGWGGLRPDVRIRMLSAGYEQGNYAKIEVDGREFTFGCRGFNTVAIDSLGRVIEAGCFDTFRGGAGEIVGLAHSP